MMSDFNSYVLEASPLLTMTLGSHLIVERHIDGLIESALARPNAYFSGNGPTYAQKVNLAEALGVIEPDLAKVFRAVNTVRNKYAHELSYAGTEKDVEKFLDALRKMSNPFFVSMVPASERELGFALASLTGWLQKEYGVLKVET